MKWMPLLSLTCGFMFTQIPFLFIGGKQEQVAKIMIVIGFLLVLSVWVRNIYASQKHECMYKGCCK